MKKLMAIAAAVVLLLAMAVSTPVAANTAIHVYPGDSIQAAVDSASPGDTIIVHAGVYHQSVVISTNDITLKGEAGAILDGTTLGVLVNGIRLSAGVSGVTIKGFEIRNYRIGIHLLGASNNSVKKNKVYDSGSDSGGWGIALGNGSNDNQVIENEVAGSITIGIAVWGSDNLIKKNQLADNLNGIWLANSDGNEVTENKVTGSTTYGILVLSATDNLIKKNQLADNSRGIVLESDANDNEVIENKVTASTGWGISVRESTGNLIKGNEVSDIGWNGIRLYDANDNEVIENKVAGSTWYGISVEGSSGNLIKQNKVSDSDLWDLYDNSFPPSLANTWEKNKYETANF